MVISVHGTINGNHGADGVVLSCAATGLFKLERKSIVLPLCNVNEGRDIEYLAIGKEDVSSVYSVADSFTDTGIDALMRRAEAGRLAIDNFNNCTTPTVKSKNHLDIAGMTKEVDFEETLLSRIDAVETIIASAKDVYDDIYILVHSRNEALTNQIDKLADKIITVIQQTRAEEGVNLSGIEEDAEGNKKKVRDISVICEDYEEESKFNVSYLRKEYGVKNVFVAPHNAQYKDATNTGSIISYISSNSRDDKFDDNDVYISSITKLVEHILGIKEIDIRDEIESKKKQIPEDDRELEEVDISLITETEVPEKKGLFGKLIFHKQVKLTDSVPDVNEFEEDSKKRKRKPLFGKKEKTLLPAEDELMTDGYQEYGENTEDDSELEDDAYFGEEFQSEESGEYFGEDSEENRENEIPADEAEFENDDDAFESSDMAEEGYEGNEDDAYEVPVQEENISADSDDDFEEIPDDEFEEIPDDEFEEIPETATDNNEGEDKEDATEAPQKVAEEPKNEEKPRRMTAADRIRMQQQGK